MNKKTITLTATEGITLTEQERKGMSNLSDSLTKQFNDALAGFVSEDELSEKMSATLKGWAKENNVTGDRLKQMEDSLAEQGKTLTAIKEQKMDMAVVGVNLKSMFLKNYDKLVEAIKKEENGFVIKADPDAIDSELIEDRGAISTTTGATLVEQSKLDPNLYLKRRGRQYVRDMARVTTVAKVQETISFDEEGDEDGVIGLVSENGLKPQVNLKLIRNKVEYSKAAGFIVVTEELMKFRTRLWGRIQSLFMDKVHRDYEKILTDKVVASATQYIGTPLDGTIANPRDYDAIIAAMCQLEQLEFQPDTLIVNTADKWKLALSTAPNGAYILPYVTNGGKFQILSLNVITTNKVAPGTFILGESDTWKIEEELPQLRTGHVNDDLLHNRLTIVGEIFFIGYLPSNLAGAWIKANFNDVKEALVAIDGGTEEPTQVP